MTIDRVPSRKFIYGGASMKRVYDKCCGIDVHKKLIVACKKRLNPLIGDLVRESVI